MTTLDVSAITLEVAGEVLTLGLGDTTRKVKLPRGERGPPGRDGLSIKGDQGDQGLVGRDGLPGRDSVVPGPKGDKGDEGPRGITPVVTIGAVSTGDGSSPPSVVVSGTPEKPVLNFVLPRGERGYTGIPGVNGKDGRTEFYELYYAGTSPRYNDEFLAHYVICDGALTFPEMKDTDLGAWTYIKTFAKLTVDGLIDPPQHLDREAARFVVISYNGAFKWTRF